MGQGAGGARAKKGRTRCCLAPMEACSPWGGQGSRGPRAGRNRSGMIRTPRVRAPDLDRDQGHRADLQIGPQSSASITNCCTKLALTSWSSRWWHRLSLDTIPQVGSASATRLSTGRRQLGTRRPVSSNGPLFCRDDSLWRRQPAENRGGIPGYR